MAIALVQPAGSVVGAYQLGQLGSFQNSPAVQVQTFTEPIAEKSLLTCVAAFWNDSGTFAVPTDTAGNTWHTAVSLQVFQLYTTAIFYCYNSLASAAGNEVSCSITSGPLGVMQIAQWSGIVSASDPLDAHNSATSMASSVPTVSLTTTQPGDLVIGWSSVFGPGGNAGGSVPGAGFTLLYDDKFIDLLQWQIAGTPGSVTITAPPAEAKWQILGAAFKALQPNPALDGANT